MTFGIYVTLIANRDKSKRPRVARAKKKGDERLYFEYIYRNMYNE